MYTYTGCLVTLWTVALVKTNIFLIEFFYMGTKLIFSRLYVFLSKKYIFKKLLNLTNFYLSLDVINLNADRFVIKFTVKR